MGLYDDADETKLPPGDQRLKVDYVYFIKYNTYFMKPLSLKLIEHCKRFTESEKFKGYYGFCGDMTPFCVLEYIGKQLDE